MEGKVEFNIKIYFSNGIEIEKTVSLDKAFSLSMKKNVIIDENSDLYEIKGIGDKSIVIPINMIFVIDAAPKFQHIDRVSRFMLYKRDGGRCSYCGKEITQKESTIDHVVPKKLGGKTTWENCVLSCKECNCKKDAKTLEECRMKLHTIPYNPKIKKN